MSVRIVECDELCYIARYVGKAELFYLMQYNHETYSERYKSEQSSTIDLARFYIPEVMKELKKLNCIDSFGKFEYEETLKAINAMIYNCTDHKEYNNSICKILLDRLLLKVYKQFEHYKIINQPKTN